VKILVDIIYLIGPFLALAAIHFHPVAVAQRADLFLAL
jgi:hypothetical protein